MKRFLLATIFAIFVSLLVMGTAFAQEGEVQEDEAIQLVNPFTWLTSDPPKWDQGALYAGLGLIGALVTVFGLVGGVFPGTAGSVRIDEGLKRLEEREKVMNKLIHAPDSDSKRMKIIETATNLSSGF